MGVLLLTPILFHICSMDLKQVIQSIESGEMLRLRVLTANIKKGTGGEVLEIPRCHIARNSNGSRLPVAGGHSTRNPNHNTHFTRNIEMLPSKRIISIHPILVTHVNQEAVV